MRCVATMLSQRNLFTLIVATAIAWAIVPKNDLFAQEESLSRLDTLLLNRASSKIDSTVITGMLGDINEMLLRKFKPQRLTRFYDAVKTPADYFTEMKEVLGWNFGTYTKNIQEFIIKRQGPDTTNNLWSIHDTPNFKIFYMPSSSDSANLQILGEYLEAEFTEMKTLLVIDENDNVRSLFIRSFYPSSRKSYEIPDPPDYTDKRIQILLFPDLIQFQRHFPYEGVDKETGGMCLFSLYQRPEQSPSIYINVRVAMVFGGYISFPFLTHELAHALHFIYYSDLDTLDTDAAKLSKIYETEGKEAYNNFFWPTFRDRIPGNNGIFEEAIANYAMFSTGPFLRSGIVPPLRYLIDRKIKPKSKLISKGAQGAIDFGLLDFIGSKLKLSRTPEQKVVEEIFSWADFLKYLNASRSPQQMRLLYSVKEQDLSSQFNAIFGQPIGKSELEWCKSFSN